MTGDRFEHDLRAMLRSEAPKEPPMSLATRVASIPAEVAPAPRRAWRRERLTALGAAAAVVIAVGGLLLGALTLRPLVGPVATSTPAPSPSPASLPEGPLTFDYTPPGAIGVGVDSIEPGVPFVWGYTRLYDPGSDTAVLDDVALVGATPGLELIAAGAFPLLGPQVSMISGQPVPEGLAAAMQSFPVRGASVLAGTSRDGARSTGLAFILSVPANGRYLVDGLDLTYHVGDHRYRVTVHSALDVCAGAALIGLPSPGPGEGAGAATPAASPSEPPSSPTEPHCPYGIPGAGASASPATGR